MCHYLRNFRKNRFSLDSSCRNRLKLISQKLAQKHYGRFLGNCQKTELVLICQIQNHRVFALVDNSFIRILVHFHYSFQPSPHCCRWGRARGKWWGQPISEKETINSQIKVKVPQNLLLACGRFLEENLNLFYAFIITTLLSYPSPHRSLTICRKTSTF